MPSKARADFISRLDAYDAAAKLSALASTSPNPLKDPGRLLRNGLMIVGFAALEDFLRTRSAELVGRIRGQKTRFEDLPPSFQEVTTEGAIKAAPTALRWTRAGLSLVSIQEFGRALASTMRQPYRLTGLGLYGHRPNVGHDDVSAALKSFGVGGGWTAINAMARRAGLPGLALHEDFQRIHERRNAAAHQADAAILQTELFDLVLPALAIAFAYDALLSRATRMLTDGTMTKASLVTVTEANVVLRFLDRGVAGWEEREEPSPAMIAQNTRLAPLRQAARLRAIAAGYQVLLVRPRSRTGLVWETTDAG
jgi:hypothetical protein